MVLGFSSKHLNDLRLALLLLTRWFGAIEVDPEAKRTALNFYSPL
jgi:hypothetical protein